MNRKNLIIYLFPFVLTIFIQASTIYKSTENNLTIIYHTNFLKKEFINFINHKYHKFIQTDSRSNDNSGSVELYGHHWKRALESPKFKCEKNTLYILQGYMKVDSFPKGQNVVFSITNHLQEVYWNASTQNKWEEILVPFISPKNQLCSFRVFTYSHSFSTTRTKNIINNIVFPQKPQKVDINGTNLDRSSRVYLDDFTIYEGSTYLKKRKKWFKKPFKSSVIQIDQNGNFFIQKNKKWKMIFPKLIYKGDPIQYSLYKEYGFNGIMDLWNKKQVEKLFHAGLNFFAIAAQPADRLKGSLKKRINNILHYLIKINKSSGLLMYNIDNENISIQEDEYRKKFAEMINHIDSDPNSNSRLHPIYYLNGNYGLARTYNNNYYHIMDITGTYINSDAKGSTKKLRPPLPTLKIMQITKNQISPACVIQLQSYLEDKFIPSLFYGLIQGGKVISVWRDGSSEGNFTKHIWAKDIKDVFSKIDSMLPILYEDIETDWNTTIKGKNPYINIGHRTHDGSGYLIISNHANIDQNISIKINGIPTQTLSNYFTKKSVATKKNGWFDFTIGHGNNGYMVLKIISE